YIDIYINCLQAEDGIRKRNVTGFKTCALPNYEEMVKKLREMGYLGIGWSIDSEDWRGISKEEIKKRVLNDMHPGSIVLMHAAGNVPGTPEALDELLTYLKKNGYQFVTIPDMWKIVYK